MDTVMDTVNRMDYPGIGQAEQYSISPPHNGLDSIPNPDIFGQAAEQ